MTDTDEEIAEKVKELWNWIASNMTTGDISSVRRSQAFLPVFKKEMAEYLVSFSSRIRSHAEADGAKRERLSKLLEDGVEDFRTNPNTGDQYCATCGYDLDEYGVCKCGVLNKFRATLRHAVEKGST